MSLEERYGTWLRLFSDRATITCREERDQGAQDSGLPSDSKSTQASVTRMPQEAWQKGEQG